ncbi:MAG: hypothetical protein RIC87_12560 [Kiloniellales bacterium]
MSRHKNRIEGLEAEIADLRQRIEKMSAGIVTQSEGLASGERVNRNAEEIEECRREIKSHERHIADLQAMD